MRELYADFNDIYSDGVLYLTCVGSVASIAALGEPLSEGEEVWLSDGELRIRATVSRDGEGWAARADWTSFV